MDRVLSLYNMDMGDLNMKNAKLFLAVGVVAFSGQATLLQASRNTIWDDLDGLVNQTENFVVRTVDQGRCKAGRVIDELKDGVGVSGVKVGQDSESNLYRVEKALPGYKKENIDVEVEKGASGSVNLNIKAKAIEEKSSESKSEADENDDSKLKSYERSQFFGSRSESLSVPLPSFVDSESAKVSYEDGVLIVTFKINEEKKEKVIKLKID
jgi:HSP20 family molecular chaperone IbpA